MARRRRYSRRRKTALWIAGSGVAIGLAAVFLWPLVKRRFQNPTITIPESEIGVTRSLPPINNSSTGDDVVYDPSQPINEGALTWLTPEQRMTLEWG